MYTKKAAAFSASVVNREKKPIMIDADASLAW